jgi:hypothetical protein
MGKMSLDQKMAAINRRFYIQMTVTVAVMLPVSVAISYCMALVGHPVAYWLWHNILGVM